MLNSDLNHLLCFNVQCWKMANVLVFLVSPIVLIVILSGQRFRSTFAQEVTIFPIGRSPVVKIPSESTSQPLLSIALLLCGIEPSSLESPENYTARWITPNGGIIDVHLKDRFVFFEDDIAIDDTGTKTVPGTALLVKQLSYLDDGTVYTCEGRSTALGNSSPWASATIELQLCLELQVNSSTVIPSANDSSAELSCEMGAFIRPDSFLIWEGPGGRRITGGTKKYQITFSDGSPEQAVNRTIELVPSRVSTLTIFNLEPSDAGNYTCSVMGTDQAVSINLVMEETTPMMNFIEDEATVTSNPSPLTTTTSSPTPTKPISFIPIIVGSVAGALGLSAILVSFIVLCILLKCKSSKETLSIASSYPIYDYPIYPPENNDYQIVVDKRSVDGMPSDTVMERNEAYGLSSCTLDEDLYCDLNGSSSAADEVDRGSGRIIIAMNEAYGENISEETDENMQGN